MCFDNFDMFNKEKSGLVDRSSERAKKNIWFYNADIKFSRNFNGLIFFELVFQIVQSQRSVDFERTFLCLQICQKNHEIFVRISALIMGYT